MLFPFKNRTLKKSVFTVLSLTSIILLHSCDNSRKIKGDWFGDSIFFSFTENVVSFRFLSPYQSYKIENGQLLIEDYRRQSLGGVEYIGFDILKQSEDSLILRAHPSSYFNDSTVIRLITSKLHDTVKPDDFMGLELNVSASDLFNQREIGLDNTGNFKFKGDVTCEIRLSTGALSDIASKIELYDYSLKKNYLSNIPGKPVFKLKVTYNNHEREVFFDDSAPIELLNIGNFLFYSNTLYCSKQ